MLVAQDVVDERVELRNVTLENSRSRFQSSSESLRGGAFACLPCASLKLVNVTLFNNTVEGSGGGLFVTHTGTLNASMQLIDTDFVENSASVQSGAAYLNYDADILLSNVNFVENVADGGDAAFTILNVQKFEYDVGVLTSNIGTSGSPFVRFF